MEARGLLFFIIALLLEYVNGEQSKPLVEITIPDKLTVYVVPTENGVNRMEEFASTWSKYDIFELVEIQNSASQMTENCKKAFVHLKLLDKMYQDKDDIIMIMEDNLVPSESFNPEFLLTALKKAVKIPFWHILNLAPWFTKQPDVSQINEHLVTIDYFHNTSMIIYHRRTVESFLISLNTVVETGDCTTIETFFHKFEANRKPAVYMSLSHTQAVPIDNKKLNNNNNNDKVDICAVNAALAGKRVKRKVKKNKKSGNSYETPLFGYYEKGKLKGWSHKCNLENDNFSDLKEEEVVDRVKF